MSDARCNCYMWNAQVFSTFACQIFCVRNHRTIHALDTRLIRKVRNATSYYSHSLGSKLCFHLNRHHPIITTSHSALAVSFFSRRVYVQAGGFLRAPVRVQQVLLVSGWRSARHRLPQLHVSGRLALQQEDGCVRLPPECQVQGQCQV